MTLEHAPGVLTLNTELSIIDADLVALALLQLPPETLIGSSLNNLIANADRGALDAAFHQLRKTGRCDWSNMVRRPDGTSIQLRFSGTTTASNNCVLRIEPNRALDEHRNAGEFQRLFDLSRDLFVVCDRNARVIATNQAVLDHHGGVIEDFIGKTLDHFVAPGGEQVLEDVARRVSAGEKHVRFEMPTHDAAGNLAIMEGVTTFDRETQRWYTIQRNITEKVEQAKALQEATKAAEAAVEARSLFLANMSHEVRTPLNGLIGLTTLLLETDLTADQREMLEAMNGSGELLLNVINDVLDFSKIEAGKMEVEFVPTSVASLLKSSRALFSSLAESKGLPLDLSIDPELEKNSYELDGPRLQQIVSNLVSNALKFTQQGGVQIKAQLLKEQTAERQILEVCVTDTGIGMDSETLTQVFEPFTQADNSISRRFGGTGLGLSICQQLATLMDGSVTALSRPEVGSSFTVRLPTKLSQRIAHRESPDVVKDLSFLSNDTLLVEDNPVNRTVAMRMLRHFGIDADQATNGEEAITALSNKPYRVVLMDMQMPICSGPEATRRIRQTPQLPQPFIIALTANAMQSDRQACLDAGMDGFLAKPLRMKGLAKALAAVPVDQPQNAG